MATMITTSPNTPPPPGIRIKSSEHDHIDTLNTLTNFKTDSDSSSIEQLPKLPLENGMQTNYKN